MSGLSRVVSGLFVTLAFGFLAVALHRLLHGSLGGFAAEISWVPLVLSGAGMFGLIVTMSEIWRRLAQHLGAGPVSPALGLHIHIVGWIGRYIPGKVAGMFGKVLLAERHGLGRAPSASAVAHEQLYFFVVGAVLAALLQLPIQPLALVLAVPLGLTAVSGLLWFSLTHLVSLLGRVSQHLPLASPPSFWTHLILTYAYSVPHLLVGAGFYLMLQSIGVSEIGLLQAVGILTAAHVAGMLAFFVPAGVGAREAALTALLSPHLGLDQALAVAAVARLWATTCDGIAGLYSVAFWLTRLRFL